MQEALYKPVDVESPNGLWGFYNTLQPGLTASEDGYLVIVAPDEKLLRLDDFTTEQEKAFWDFTFARAAKGLKDKCSRGFAEAAEPDHTQYTVMCAVNDGPVAWQGVGTSHSHVIWFKEESGLDDISERLIADRTKFSGATKPHFPVISVRLDTGDARFVENLRDVRCALGSAFTQAGMARDDIGFSHYTAESYGHDLREGGQMVLELWNRDHDAVASLTQFVRYWNGLWETPASGSPMGLQYQAFRPAQP